VRACRDRTHEARRHSAAVRDLKNSGICAEASDSSLYGDLAGVIRHGNGGTCIGLSEVASSVFRDVRQAGPTLRLVAARRPSTCSPLTDL